MGEQGVGGHGQPFGGFSVGGHDGGLGLVAFDHDFVEVAGFGGVEAAQREVVDDEDVDGCQPADLGVDGVVEAGGAQPGEQLVCAAEYHGVTSANSHVSQCCCQVCLADADGSVNDSGLAGVEEPQRGQVTEQGAVIA